MKFQCYPRQVAEIQDHHAAVAVVVVVAAEGAEDVEANMNTNNIPSLGVGLSFRSQFKNEVFLNQDKIDFLEIVADHYIDASYEKMKELEVLQKHFVIIPHAINLSLGSASPVNKDYIQKLAALIKRIDPPYWSEHISFTSVNGLEIGHLSPLPFTRQSVETLIRNIEAVSKYISKPLVLENISYLVDLSDEMEEAEFLTEILSKTDCGLLLDVTNLYYNSLNHNYHSSEFLKKLPLDKIIQLHFTGGMKQGDYYIDNHSAKTPDEVWALMDEIFSFASVKGAILERDDSFPVFEEMLEDLKKARALGTKHRLWN